MDFTQVVGFLVTMAAILYMFIKRAQDLRQRSQSEGEEDPKQANKLNDFLKALDIDMEESKDFQPPPKPKVQKPAEAAKIKANKPKAKPIYQTSQVHKKDTIHEEFRSDMDDFQSKVNIENRRYIKSKYGEADYGDHLISQQFRGEKSHALIGYKKPSRINILVKSLPSKKEMVLLHEVFDKPKGMKF